MILIFLRYKFSILFHFTKKISIDKKATFHLFLYAKLEKMREGLKKEGKLYNAEFLKTVDLKCTIAVLFMSFLFVFTNLCITSDRFRV